MSTTVYRISIEKDLKMSNVTQIQLLFNEVYTNSNMSAEDFDLEFKNTKNMVCKYLPDNSNIFEWKSLDLRIAYIDVFLPVYHEKGFVSQHIRIIVNESRVTVNDIPVHNESEIRNEIRKFVAVMHKIESDDSGKKNLRIPSVVEIKQYLVSDLYLSNITITLINELYGNICDVTSRRNGKLIMLSYKGSKPKWYHEHDFYVNIASKSLIKITGDSGSDVEKIYCKRFKIDYMESILKALYGMIG